MVTAGAQTYIYRRDDVTQWVASGFFIVAIMIVGAAMMTLTSSPLVKGAAFLWLPAALQLIAGVWLKPIRGFLAGAVGAQLAGALAYGGWAAPDWIMNFVAGGLANSLLPGLLFRGLRVDPALGANPIGPGKASITVAALTVLVLVIALASWGLGQVLGLDFGNWAFLAAIILLLALPFILSNMQMNSRHFVLGLIIVVFACAMSAAIGVCGAVVGGQSWKAAFIGTGLGWFLGDTASGILGLYVLSHMTKWAQQIGVAPSLAAVPPSVAR